MFHPRKKATLASPRFAPNVKIAKWKERRPLSSLYKRKSTMEMICKFLKRSALLHLTLTLLASIVLPHKMLLCDHSNESYWAVLSCSTVCYAVCLCHPMSPFVPLCSLCPLVSPVSPCVPLYPLCPPVSPCVPLCPLCPLVSLCPLWPFVSLVSPVSSCVPCVLLCPLWPLVSFLSPCVPYVPLCPLCPLVSPCIPCVPLWPYVSLVSPVSPCVPVSPVALCVPCVPCVPLCPHVGNAFGAPKKSLTVNAFFVKSCQE